MPLQASARCITACHVPCECKTRASCFIVKNVRYANAAGEMKKARSSSFSTIVLSSTYPFIWACADCSSPQKHCVSRDRRYSMKCLSVLTLWSTLREIPFLSSAENIRESTMAIEIIIRVIFFNHMLALQDAIAFHIALHNIIYTAYRIKNKSRKNCWKYCCNRIFVYLLWIKGLSVIILKNFAIPQFIST